MVSTVVIVTIVSVSVLLVAGAAISAGVVLGVPSSSKLIIKY